MYENSKPRVSIIIPCYNTASYVSDALDSVFAQTFTDFEVIVINDGSPDTPALRSVLKPYWGQIVYLEQENRGLAGARNAALVHASGDYVALLDSDDYWEPTFLEVLVDELDTQNDLDVIFPNARIVGDAIEAGQTVMERSPPRPITFERLLAQQCYVFGGVLARRQVLVSAGQFDETLRSSEDYDLWLRILRMGGHIGFNREVLVNYRKRHDSLTANVDRMFQHHHKVWDKVEATMDLSLRETAIVQAQRRKTAAMQRLVHGKAAVAAGEYSEARALLGEANREFRSTKLSVVVLLLVVSPRLLRWCHLFVERYRKFRARHGRTNRYFSALGRSAAGLHSRGLDLASETHRGRR